MGKRLPYTPYSQIVSALRRLWLRSRERQTAIRRDKYSCRGCGVKQSKAKGKEQRVEVHHVAGQIEWEELVNLVREFLLCDPEDLITLCPKCHKERHEQATKTHGCNSKRTT